MKIIFLISFLWTLSTRSWADETNIRGVDLRLQFVSGNLQFTSISGIDRKFSGKGSEMIGSFYLLEYKSFRSVLFLSSRLMTWTGLELAPGENDDFQTISVGPGLEFQFGPVFVRASPQTISANAYFISTNSFGRQFSMSGTSYAIGFNHQFKKIGLGLSMSTLDMTVPGSSLNLSADTQSKYSEKSFSLNIIYFFGLPPKAFFKELF